jgi:hypothetical protein
MLVASALKRKGLLRVVGHLSPTILAWSVLEALDDRFLLAQGSIALTPRPPSGGHHLRTPGQMLRSQESRSGVVVTLFPDYLMHTITQAK